MRVAVFVLAALMLAGCATLTSPKTPDQTVYATYGLYTAVAHTTADLTQSGALSLAQARTVQATLKTLRPEIDAAKTMVAGGGTPSADRLAVIRAIQNQLLALQTRLQDEAAR